MLFYFLFNLISAYTKHFFDRTLLFQQFIRKSICFVIIGGFFFPHFSFYNELKRISWPMVQATDKV